MKLDFKEIQIGNLISQLVIDRGIEVSRICSFFKCTEGEIKKMYLAESINTEILLKWSKLLQYDFFRIYSQHLILYAPQSSIKEQQAQKKTSLPLFRKNIYTKEVIDFILEQIESNEMTKSEVMKRYKIPKTTLYKWIIKYKNDNKK